MMLLLYGWNKKNIKKGGKMTLLYTADTADRLSMLETQMARSTTAPMILISFD